MKTSKLVLAFSCLLGLSAVAQGTANSNTRGNTVLAKPALARDYCLPDSPPYYDMTSKRYIYVVNGKQVYVKHLPGKYKRYPYYKSRRLKIAGYRSLNPYAYYERHNRVYGRMGNVVYKKPARVAVFKKYGRGRGYGHRRQ